MRVPCLHIQSSLGWLRQVGREAGRGCPPHPSSVPPGPRPRAMAAPVPAVTPRSPYNYPCVPRVQTRRRAVCALPPLHLSETELSHRREPRPILMGWWGEFWQFFSGCPRWAFFVPVRKEFGRLKVLKSTQPFLPLQFRGMGILF